MSKGNWIGSLLLAGLCCGSVAALSQDMPGLATPPPVKDDGTITVPTFDLPFSSYASPEATREFVDRLRNPAPISMDITRMRAITDQRMMPFITEMGRLYPYEETKSEVAGVTVRTYVPKAGIAPENANRVLIEVHGGAFVTGNGGPGGAIESIPVMGAGRIKVVSVDYRLAPEHRFPSGSEDLAAVYRELLKSYPAKNIGIYGCSAGGLLAAQSIPWFLKEKLPLPGAIGILCASTHAFGEGDSTQLWQRLGSVIRLVPAARPSPEGFGRTSPYFAGANPRDPLAIPAMSRDVLKAFPPTLFLTGTRAPEMSAAAQSHIELRELGVKSDLILFDGLDHGFMSNPALPESKRAYALTASFFSENLGREPLRK